MTFLNPFQSKNMARSGIQPTWVYTPPPELYQIIEEQWAVKGTDVGLSVCVVSCDFSSSSYRMYLKKLAETKLSNKHHLAVTQNRNKIIK